MLRGGHDWKVLTAMAVAILAAGCETWARLEFDADESAEPQIQSMRLTLWLEGHSPADSDAWDYQDVTAFPDFPFGETFVPGSDAGTAFWMRAEISTDPGFAGGEIQTATMQDWVFFRRGGARREYVFSGACAERETPCDSGETCEQGECIDIEEGPYAACAAACERAATCDLLDSDDVDACASLCISEFSIETTECLLEQECSDLSDCDAELPSQESDCIPDSEAPQPVTVGTPDFVWLDNIAGPRPVFAFCDSYAVTGDGLLASMTTEESGITLTELSIDGAPAGRLGPFTSAACQGNTTALAQENAIYVDRGSSWTRTELSDSESVVQVWVSPDAQVFAITPTALHRSCSSGGFERIPLDEGTSEELLHVTGVAGTNEVYAATTDGNLLRLQGGELRALATLPIGTANDIKALYGSPIPTGEGSTVLRVLDDNEVLWESTVPSPSTSDWTALAMRVAASAMSEQGLDVILRYEGDTVATRDRTVRGSTYARFDDGVDALMFVSGGAQALRGINGTSNVSFVGERGFIFNIFPNPLLVSYYPWSGSNLDVFELDVLRASTNFWARRGAFESWGRVAGTTCTTGYWDVGAFIGDQGRFLFSQDGLLLEKSADCLAPADQVESFPYVSFTDIAVDGDHEIAVGNVGMNPDALEPFVIDRELGDGFIRQEEGLPDALPLSVWTSGDTSIVVTDDANSPVYRRLAALTAPWTPLDPIGSGPNEEATPPPPRIRGTSATNAYVIYEGKLFHYDGSATLAPVALPTDDELLRDVVLYDEGELALLVFDTTLYEAEGDTFVLRSPILPSTTSTLGVPFRWTEAGRGDGIIIVVGSVGSAIELH